MSHCSPSHAVERILDLPNESYTIRTTYSLCKPIYKIRIYRHQAWHQILRVIFLQVLTYLLEWLLATDCSEMLLHILMVCTIQPFQLMLHQHTSDQVFVVQWISLMSLLPLRHALVFHLLGRISSVCWFAKVSSSSMSLGLVRDCQSLISWILRFKID